MSPKESTVKLKRLLPVIFPIEALKFLSRTRFIDEVSSGKDVAIPKNTAPATVLPKESLSDRESVACVSNILIITRLTENSIKRVIISFTVKLTALFLSFDEMSSFFAVLIFII